MKQNYHTIKFGDYECDKFHKLHGINDPLVQQYITEVKQLDWTDYELWFYGGIIKHNKTKDIDGTIVGPYTPHRIKYLLDNVVKIGFNMGVYPDIRYLKEGEMFDMDEVIANEREITNVSIMYAGCHYKNDRKYFLAEKNSDGLYERVDVFPYVRTKLIYKNHPLPKTPPQRIV